MSEVQKKLQELSESYQGLQTGEKTAITRRVRSNGGTELGTAVDARQKLESQQQENATVKKVRRSCIQILARADINRSRNLTFSTTMRTSTSRLAPCY